MSVKISANTIGDLCRQPPGRGFTTCAIRFVQDRGVRDQFLLLSTMHPSWFLIFRHPKAPCFNLMTSWWHDRHRNARGSQLPATGRTLKPLALADSRFATANRAKMARTIGFRAYCAARRSGVIRDAREPLHPSATAFKPAAGSSVGVFW